LRDICAPHPWAKAQNRPLNGKNIKSILLFSNMCILFAIRDYQGIPTEQTHISKVFYPRRTTNHLKNKYPKPTHHGVFFNIERRDSHPYASPEGVGRTPPRGGQMADAERHPRRRHVAKGIELGTPRNNPAYDY